MEIWVKLKEYPDYEVSNLGNLRRFFKTTGYKLLDGGKKITGYIQDLLTKEDGTTVYELRHRLVAKAFLVEYAENLQVNHINGVRNNNKVTNLEWCTASENIKHSFEIGREGMKGEDNPRSKLTQKDVDRIRELGNTLSHTDIAKMYGMSQGHITAIINLKKWKPKKIEEVQEG